MCVICRKRFLKTDLRRYTLTSTGELAYDADQSSEGRGWYVCGQESCQQKFVRYRPAARHVGRNKNR